MKKKGRKVGADFWNHEYGSAEHLALSTNPSEDLLKFLRWLERESGRQYLNPTMSAMDLGCGNGRNLLLLAKTYAMRGIGYDISATAIAQAKKLASGLPLSFDVRSIAEPIPQKDASQALVLDMMASHVLTHHERAAMHEEILRILRPGGWFFLKTFLADEDPHARRLLRENPGKEAGSYIHPVIGVAEYVFTEADIVALVEQRFTVHKVLKSHGHLRKAGSQKRRSISIYAQKA
jgi:SAM-dependent methyltransferase